MIDADLATVLAEADKVVRIGGSTPRLVHVELQASYDPRLAVRMLAYNVLLHRRHGLPVASVVVLLRSQADGPTTSGAVELAWGDDPYLSFAYRVIRAWTPPVDEVLAGGLGTLPLAPLASVAPDELPILFRRMNDRFAAEAAPGEAASLWAATRLLLGLRYSEEVVEMLGGWERVLEESWTYQELRGKAIAEGRAEGRAVEARRILVRLGSRRLGTPDPEVQVTIDALADVEQIERMTERVLDATTWAEVLGTA